MGVFSTWTVQFVLLFHSFKPVQFRLFSAWTVLLKTTVRRVWTVWTVIKLSTKSFFRKPLLMPQLRWSLPTRSHWVTTTPTVGKLPWTKTPGLRSFNELLVVSQALIYLKPKLQPGSRNRLKTSSQSRETDLTSFFPSFAVDMLAKAENALGRYKTFRFVSFFAF